ncbi:hypothetical protein B0T14DRAFT_565755 [Immersiella caudata]|uniref:Uncharacterized protein n=1 Tax=Immersiella caudata TaxID=314043 RepID=A0AA40BYQ6_9PEZI|nr:hypothetical protein B0T14DRAFT_565755 [Immersiella caudata]
MAEPSEPLEQEKNEYYFGLPSKPRLVARSNFATPWSLEWCENYVVRKAISVIGEQHVAQDILDKYDPSKITTCLGESMVDWTTIDVIRIGTEHSTSDPIVLWVGVLPGSLSWQEGVEVACRCRRLLLEAGLDMHCEIRESVVKRMTSVPVIPLGEGMDPSLSATLSGQAIAAEKSPTKEGTLGLYLSVDSVPCALVARHVVGEDDGPLDGYHVIMPGQTTYEAIRKQQKEDLAVCTTRAGKDACLKLGKHLGQLEQLGSRRIGHVLFSPPRVPIPRSDFSNQLWLPDYALIALDEERLPFGSLSNMVQIQMTFRQLRLIRQYHSGREQPTKPLHLHGTFTPGDHRVVAKYGRSTGLT